MQCVKGIEQTPRNVFRGPLITGLSSKRLCRASGLVLYLIGKNKYSGPMALQCKLSLQRAVESSIGKTSG